DGVAEARGEPVFVPYALPGETVRAEVGVPRARLLEVLNPSPYRVEPVCRHFGACGGCAIQHLAPDKYGEWKRDIVAAAFATRGLDVEIGEMVSAGRGARRRAVFTASRDGRDVALGF